MDTRFCFVTILLSLEILRVLSRSGLSYLDTLSLMDPKSFQSSTKVLDPTANPSLFQSTLAIIIKVRVAQYPIESKLTATNPGCHRF